MSKKKSQFKDVSKLDIQDQQIRFIPQGTRKSTEQWSTRFDNFLIDQKLEFDKRWFETSEGKQRAVKVIRLYILALQKEDGYEYKAGSLNTGISSLIRHFKQSNPLLNLDFYHDPILKQVTDQLHVKMQDLQASGLGEPDQARALTDEEVLKVVKFLDIDTPDGLRNLVMFYLSLFCCFRGGEIHKCMVANLQRIEDQDAACYKYTIFIDKNHQGGKNGHYQPQVGYIPPDDPGQELRFCPVALFDKYMSKCPTQGNTKGRLFLNSVNNWQLSPTWYTCNPVGYNNASSILKDIMTKCDIRGKITWHSLRATAITKLANQGVSEQHIKLKSGHRSDAVRKYMRTDESQKMQISCLLKSTVSKVPQVQFHDNLPLIVQQSSHMNLPPLHAFKCSLNQPQPIAAENSKQSEPRFAVQSLRSKFQEMALDKPEIPANSRPHHMTPSCNPSESVQFGENQLIREGILGSSLTSGEFLNQWNSRRQIDFNQPTHRNLKQSKRSFSSSSVFGSVNGNGKKLKGSDEMAYQDSRQVNGHWQNSNKITDNCGTKHIYAGTGNTFVFNITHQL
ncbi:hypothetical protein MP228_005131 [Amoeboaphelidium protococcarum]|nr:hypothetical protein MP228_005131 [Amoeboaphelidium protococcarum]